MHAVGLFVVLVGACSAGGTACDQRPAPMQSQPGQLADPLVHHEESASSGVATAHMQYLSAVAS